MPLHPIYGKLTGSTRLRSGWRGRLVIQVESVEGDWFDATERQLRAIGFEGSSAKSRKHDEANPPLPPPDYTVGEIGLKWR
jgi:hypothetical protein